MDNDIELVTENVTEENDKDEKEKEKAFELMGLSDKKQC